MTDRNYKIDSISRAISVLEILAERDEPCRVTDISRALECSKNTVFRILKTFELHGYVRETSDSSYELTLKLLNLGESVLSNLDLHRLARPYLEALVEEFGETATLGIPEGNGVVYVDRVLGKAPYRTSFGIGSRALIHSTSIGKAVLAFSSEEDVERIVEAGLPHLTEYTITDRDRLFEQLEEIRRRGYSIDDQENVLGIRCVGAPVFSRKGAVIGAVSVSGMAVRITKELIEVIAPKLVEQTFAISARMGYTRHSGNLDYANRGRYGQS